MIQIDRTEIEAWGKRQEPKGNFPLLIAKLIFETTPRSTFFEIPTGSGVFLDDWDGYVKCPSATTFVPEDISVWECKTNGAKTQADSDYNKRTRDSHGIDKSKTTFIFVTTKTWKGKKKWQEEKQTEKIWKDVRVYDAINLSNWINITEVAFKWLSAQLGRSHNCLTIEDFWENWSVGPKKTNGHIILTPSVVTAGRDFECQKIIDFIKGEPNLMRVKGSTKDEAIAFIIASVKLSSEQFNVQFNSKSLVIENLQDFRLAKKSDFNLNLIAKFEDTSELYSAVGRNHHVLLPLGPDDPTNSQDIITLPYIDRDGMIQALIESRLSDEEANRLSKESARDITILKRLIGFELNKAKWKFSKEIDQLVPVLLIGRWNDTKEGDLKVIEQLSGESYDIYSKKLNKWLDVESPPLIKIGSSWRLTSPLDAWTNLSHLISAKDFYNLKTCFLEVMKEINPVFELEHEHRIMASFHGKESQYSTWCREGLTQSLILVGLYGDNLKFQYSFRPQEWVDNIIKELLFDAPGDLWASRNHEMPLIAEASPKSFFESAYYSLSLDDKPIMDMFIEEDDFISPASNHTGLLWALEGLAWMEEYVYDASMLLARLTTLDPGGKLANRPMNSLRGIYKTWFYQTLAPFKDRMIILEQIIKTEYETGWELLVALIPRDNNETAFPTHKLRWRLFERSFINTYNWSEIYDTYSHVIELLIKYFDFSEKKLIDLLEKYEYRNLKKEGRERILLFIESNIYKIEIVDNSAWGKMRETLYRHRSYPNAVWSLSEEELKKYDDLYKRLEPIDPIERIVWMYDDSWPNFPDGIIKEDLSIDEQQDLIIKRRVEGLKFIYKEFGFGKVKNLVHRVKETWVYGDTMALIIDDENEILILCEFLKEENESILHFIQRFIMRKSLINGIEWVFKLYHKLKTNRFTDKHLGRLFQQVIQTKVVWDFIDNTNIETQNTYWREIYPNFWNESIEELIYGIDRLLQVNRFISALYIAYHDAQKLPTDKLIEVLTNAVTRKSEEKRQFDGHHATILIEEIESRNDIDNSVLLKIEWLYLPLLSSYWSGHQPKLLHKELSMNPEFFIEVLTLVYKSDIEEEPKEDISEEVRQNRGKNAYSLLRSWETIPGVNDSGIINESFMWDWINKVRELAKQSGRLDVADVHIGQVLAKYPESEEPWPPEQICNIIEKIKSDSLKSGFSTSTFNKRGSSTRGVFEGGNIERGHANYFYSQADKIKYEFPETAKILINLAKGYEEDAKRMDESAERDKLDH